MKKLRLKALELGVNEWLTRNQLKQVLGGDGSGDGCLETPCNNGSQGSVCTPPGGTEGSGRCNYVLCTGYNYYYYRCDYP